MRSLDAGPRPRRRLSNRTSKWAAPVLAYNPLLPECDISDDPTEPAAQARHRANKAQPPWRLMRVARGSRESSSPRALLGLA